MLEVHAILHRQRCYENMTEKTGTLSDAYDRIILLLFSILCMNGEKQKDIETKEY